MDAVDADRSGGGTYDTVCTASTAAGGIFHGAVVCIVNSSPSFTTTDTLINFFHDSGANTRYIGHAVIPRNDTASNTDPPFEVPFTPLGGPVELDQNDQIQAAFMSGSMTAHVRALGGNF